MNEKVAIGAIVAIALLVGAGSAIVLIENGTNPELLDEDRQPLLDDSALASESTAPDQSNVAKFVAAMIIGLGALLIVRHARD